MEVVLQHIVNMIFLVGIGYFSKMVIDSNNKNSHKMFVEYVKAIKSKDLTEYVTTQPEENEVEVIPEDEIMELSELPPEKLLKLIRSKE